MPNGYDDYVASLESCKRTASSGVEFWMARDLLPLLGYADWRNFLAALRRAHLACESAGQNAESHFGATTKKVSIGSGAEREASDYFLTRYACYLLAMNAESSKPEVGFAQTYFAFQTRRQEIEDQLAATEKRFELRDRVRGANKGLAGAAKRAGVVRFGIFQDEGYKGLYAGLGRNEIKTLKGIDPKEDLLDCMGRTELAANEFRITQTEEKLVRENVTGEAAAFKTHHTVGTKVRATIKKIGGTMPEHLRAEQSLKKLSGKRRTELKSAPKQITGS